MQKMRKLLTMILTTVALGCYAAECDTVRQVGYTVFAGPA